MSVKANEVFVPTQFHLELSLWIQLALVNGSLYHFASIKRRKPSTAQQVLIFAPNPPEPDFIPASAGFLVRFQAAILSWILVAHRMNKYRDRLDFGGASFSSEP